MNAPQFKGYGFVQQYGAFLVRLSLVMDAAFIVAGYYASVLLRGGEWTHADLALASLAIAGFLVATSCFDIYRSWRTVRLRHEMVRLLVCVSITLAFTLALLAFGYWDQPRAPALPVWFLLAFAGMVGARWLGRMVLRMRRAHGHDRRTIAFAGCTEIALNLNDIFRSHGWMGIDVAGYFDDRSPTGNRPPPANARLAGNFADLVRLARSSKISAVYICLPMSAEKRVKQLIGTLSSSAVSVYFCPGFFEFGLMNARWDDVFGQPVIGIVDSPFVGRERVVKRFEDLLLASLLLPIALVPMLVVALAVATTSRGPILFRQTRYGLDGRSFQIWKFRTMYAVERDDEFRQVAHNDARVTPLGAYLRRTSLDELPQIFNVIQGDMSFVGPRPHPVKLNETHRDLIDGYMLRHKVKPGITGLAQVNGCRGETRERAQMAKRIEYDLTYIRNWSFWLDCKILARTVSVVWSGDNAR